MLYQCVPSKKVPICLKLPSDTFVIVCIYSLATKRTEEKRVEENANVSFFDTIKRALDALRSLTSLTSVNHA